MGMGTVIDMPIGRAGTDFLLSPRLPLKFSEFEIARPMVLNRPAPDTGATLGGLVLSPTMAVSEAHSSLHDCRPISPESSNSLF